MSERARFMRYAGRGTGLVKGVAAKALGATAEVALSVREVLVGGQAERLGQYLQAKSSKESAETCDTLIDMLHQLDRYFRPQPNGTLELEGIEPELLDGFMTTAAAMTCLISLGYSPKATFELIEAAETSRQSAAPSVLPPRLTSLEGDIPQTSADIPATSAADIERLGHGRGGFTLYADMSPFAAQFTDEAYTEVADPELAGPS